jgi:hypothetical protein
LETVSANCNMDKRKDNNPETSEPSLRTDFLLLLLLPLFLLTSCNKNKYVRGTVYESGTDIPISNALIQFREEYAHGGNSSIIRYTTTDENGKYKIKYDAVGGRAYYINASNIVDGEYDVKLDRRKLAINFSLDPPAFLKVYANKTSSSNNYLMIKGSMRDVFSPKTSSPYNTLIQGSYPHSNSTNNWPGDLPYFLMAANKAFTISWTVYDNAGPTTTTGQAQFIANKGDTVSYTINFN